jgi:cytidylyltransferase-like protein
MAPLRPRLEALLHGELARICIQGDGRVDDSAALPNALLSGSFNPLHAGHLHLAQVAEHRLGQCVAFELPLRNADKPPLTIDDAERRVTQFLSIRNVWITAAATFAAKARLFPGATWIVGADTAVRIAQPHFYDGAAQRDAALEHLRAFGCRFLVAGRLDRPGSFIGLDDIELPDNFRDLFEGMSETEFRYDISSTEFRMNG